MSVYHHDNARAARRLTGFLLFLIGLALTVALYFVKTKAQAARKEATALTRHIEAETRALKVLRAELAHLQSPGRIQDLAQSTLGVVPARVDQHIQPGDIAVLFPRVEGDADTGVDRTEADLGGQP